MDTGVTVSDLKIELTQVRQAKSDCLTAMQDVSRPGLSYRRVLYSDLNKREREILTMISRSSDGIAMVSDFSAPQSSGLTNNDASFLDSDAP